MKDKLKTILAVMAWLACAVLAYLDAQPLGAVAIIIVPIVCATLMPWILYKRSWASKVMSFDEFLDKIYDKN